MSLKERLVLVTGGAKRVGREIALEFARTGANILLHYHTSGQAAQQVQSDIQALGVTCELLRSDLADANAIEQMFKSHAKSLSKVDVLINSASVFYKTPTQSVKDVQWEEIFKTNLIGPFTLAARLGAQMKLAKQQGVIINITDVSARKPYREYAPYCASKAALENATRVLALELAPEVRVNAVAPGAVLFPEEYKDDMKAEIIKHIPLRRAGSPGDIAQACLYLVNSLYTTGSTISVDGGRSLVG